jgi:hypothetical protein
VKVKLIFEVDIETSSKIATYLREQALLVLQARKLKIANPDANLAEQEVNFKAFIPKINAAIKEEFLIELPLNNVLFESTDLVSKEEEAAILAPEG